MKEGEKVICINVNVPSNFKREFPLKKGNEYIIRAIKRSPCCSYLWVDVGVSAIDIMQGCPHCQKLFITDGVWWFDSLRFVPVINISNKVIEVKEETILA